MSDKIQRYWVEGQLHAICDDPGSTRVKHVVRYSNHLADKTAALAAQAEEHRRLYARGEADWAGRNDALRVQHDKELEAQAEELEEEFKALLQDEQKESDFRHECVINALKSQHGMELAAKAEMHLSALQAKDQYYIKKLAEARGEGEPALIQFEHPNLIGEPCMIHRSFRGPMDRLCAHASGECVSLLVTHSMRQLDQQLVGAIVKASKRSNHHAGSAVDLNVMWDQTLYTSAKMREAFDHFHSEHPVRRFIEGVSADPILRWGGDWERKDEVHFDDNLVLRDPDEWALRVAALKGHDND